MENISVSIDLILDSIFSSCSFDKSSRNVVAKCIKADPRKYLEILNSGQLCNILEIENAMLARAFKSADKNTRNTLLNILNKAAKIKETRQREVNMNIMKYKALSTIFHEYLVIKLVCLFSNIENIAFANPNSALFKEALSEHPAVLKTNTKEKSIRFLARMAILAARVDLWGGKFEGLSQSVERFSNEISNRKTSKDKAKEKIRKTRRGGLVARKKRKRDAKRKNKNK